MHSTDPTSFPGCSRQPDVFRVNILITSHGGRQQQVAMAPSAALGGQA